MRTFQEHVSVIIPALNAAGDLPQALAAFHGASVIREVIVVDGGSSDATASPTATAGVRVIAAQRGHATELSPGHAASSGSWLLFLHADCRLGQGWEAAVRAFLAGPDAGRCAGYFDFALDDASPAGRRLERIVA